MNLEFDILIVGGGSAGCVLAHRLSADPSCRVALIEAGPDIPPDRVPASIAADGYLPDYFRADRYWTELQAYRDVIGGRTPVQIEREMTPTRYEQPRMIGGGSNVNAQVFVRGVPSDYDGWAAAGATGWAYRDCLPYFRRLEHDLDFGGPLHGDAGPMLVKRTFPEDWDELTLSVRDALGAHGIRYASDSHAEPGDGCFPFSRNHAGGRRISTAVAYLDGRTRLRPNLAIFTDTVLEQLCFDGTRVIGATARRGGQTIGIRAGRIVLSAGALHTPAILMRAGIGPASHLADHGIGVRADRPGIGANLQDHPMVGIGIHVQPHARLTDRVRGNFLMYARFSSGFPGCPTQDMRMSFGSRFDASPLGRQFAVARVGPDKAYSRGLVRLRSAHPAVEPLVAFNLLDDPRDLQRMLAGVGFIHQVLSSGTVAANTYSVFPGAFTKWARWIRSPAWYTAAMASAGAALMDRNAVIRRTAMKLVAGDRMTLAAMVNDRGALEEWVRATVLGNWHACGTCRMGAANDPHAVVDPQGAVYGVEGLHVADASVMPEIICGNTHLTTVMVAEKMSDALARPSRAAATPELQVLPAPALGAA
ncbi:MAG TPA: GMC family oxidoreductase N-terminal domain-containing protein [Thauera sp.]|jgi:5-(hydroxymethyl)furfural/furfural oxidase|nr:GMC family oxidoreductase N-terminal domain-containing protein [Rhodoferax sp.]HQZ03586.1 GMC family oxidoreductase N-terminal domain-containing protein [Thauera sp.]HRA81570.1 GMC family oxidoreductase N-terminal domain-containing protein [Thauera sp.]